MNGQGTAFVAFALTLGNDESCVPPGCSTAIWRLNRRAIDADAREYPRDHRVRVPHFAGAEFIAAPNRGGYRRHDSKDSSRQNDIVAQPHGTRERFANVGDPSFAPASDLVAEAPPTACPSRSNCTLGDDASLIAMEVWDGCLLDHEAAFWNADLQGRVVEVEWCSPLPERGKRLEQPAAQTDDVRAGTQRDPVEINRCEWFVCVVAHWTSEPRAGCVGVGPLVRERSQSRSRTERPTVRTTCLRLSLVIVPLMKGYPNDQMVRYTHDWVLFDEDNSFVVFCARTHMADPGDGSSHSATNWTRVDYAGNGLFSREEDIYNLANFAKLLEEWQAAKERAGSA